MIKFLLAILGLTWMLRFGAERAVAQSPAAWWSVLESPVVQITDPLQDFVVDSQGNVVVFLREPPNTVLTKLESGNGGQLWQQTITPPQPYEATDVYDAVAVDSQDSILFALTLVTGSSREFSVIKLAPDGTESWRTPPAPIANGVVRVLVNSNDDVIFVGNNAIKKLSGFDGSEIWSKSVNFNQVWCSRLSPTGDIVVADTYPTGDVTKLDGNSGTQLWQVPVPNLRETLGAPCPAIDSSGNIAVVSGEFSETPYYVHKLDGGSGSEIWNRQIASPLTPFSEVLSDGNDFFISHRPNRGSGTEIAKLSGANGGEVWRSPFGPNDHPAMVRLAIDEAGDLLATGRIQRRRSYFAAVLKLDGTTGKELWRQEMPSGTSVTVQSSFANQLAVIAGKFEDPLVGVSVLKIPSGLGILARQEGKKILVRDEAGTPAKRRLLAIMKSSSLKIPVPTDQNDPRTAGATVSLVNEATGEQMEIFLPPGNRWSGIGNPEGSRGYKYRDQNGEFGPCKLLVARRATLDFSSSRPGSLKVLCRGSLGEFPFSLDEPQQNQLTVTVRFGELAPQCSKFELSAVVRDAGVSNPGPQGVFLGKKAIGGPGSCPGE